MSIKQRWLNAAYDLDSNLRIYIDQDLVESIDDRADLINLALKRGDKVCVHDMDGNEYNDFYVVALIEDWEWGYNEYDEWDRIDILVGYRIKFRWTAEDEEEEKPSDLESLRTLWNGITSLFD